MRLEALQKFTKQDKLQPLAFYHGMASEVDQPFARSELFAEITAKAREFFKESFKKCVDKVKAVDQDQQLWLDMVNAPVVLPNQPNNTFFRFDHYTRRFREVLREAQSYLLPA